MHTTVFALALPFLAVLINATPTPEENPNCRGTFTNGTNSYESEGLRVTCGVWGTGDLDFHWYPVQGKNSSIAGYQKMKKQLCAHINTQLNPDTTGKKPFDIEGTVNEWLDAGFDTRARIWNQTVENGILPSVNGTNGTLPVMLSDDILGRLSLTIEVPAGSVHSFSYEKCYHDILGVFMAPDSCCYGEARQDTILGTVELTKDNGVKYTAKAEVRPQPMPLAQKRHFPKYVEHEFP